MPSLLIINAQVINEGQAQELDLFIRDGRIEAIGTDLAGRSADTIIDATGLILIPGMIDDQVHFREPGMPDKADIRSESRAAVAGGITSFMDMPNTRPPALTIEALEAKYTRAAECSIANYAFYLGASNDNLNEIRRLPIGTACGIKVFMGASTGNMLVDAPEILEAIFADAPTLIATHCEHTPTILANESRYRARYGENVPIEAHPLIRSAEACYISSEFAVSLARRHGTSLHVLHISTARELDLFEPGPVANKSITAEACVHFLAFDDRDYARLGTRIKCNPAIKTAEDRAGIIRGLLENRLDVIGTDHAPHTWAEKQQSYFKAPAGLPLVQHALPLLLEQYHDGVMDLPLIVRKTSHAVADRFRILERGYLREGYWADLVLIDLNQPTEVRRDNLLYKCGWSPFEGTTFRSSIHTTVINGLIAYQNGGVNDTIRGQRLQFGAQR